MNVEDNWEKLPILAKVEKNYDILNVLLGHK